MRDKVEVLWEDVLVWLSFDFSEELLLSLDLEHHLAMDVFDVEVFSGDHQGSGVSRELHVVQSMVATSPAVGQREAVVASGGLLQRVNSVWLCSLEVRWDLILVLYG